MIHSRGRVVARDRSIQLQFDWVFLVSPSSHLPTDFNSVSCAAVDTHGILWWEMRVGGISISNHYDRHQLPNGRPLWKLCAWKGRLVKGTCTWFTHKPRPTDRQHTKWDYHSPHKSWISNLRLKTRRGVSGRIGCLIYHLHHRRRIRRAESFYPGTSFVFSW